MYKYQTKGDAELTIPGVGKTVDGMIESEHPIENPNLVLVSGPDDATPAPTHMNGVAPQNAQPAVPQVNQQAPAAPVQPQAESENK